MYKNVDNILDFGYDGFEITQNGIRAIEEYETFIKTEQRDNETLKIAKQANELSTESNHIAKSANKNKFYSNRYFFGFNCCFRFAGNIPLILLHICPRIFETLYHPIHPQLLVANRFQ